MKFLLAILILSIFLWELFVKWPDNLLHIVVCDVGQGDAILLRLGYTQVLIDTGPDESVLACLNEQLPFWDKKIDVLVLTHFDDDHIGGFNQLTQVYDIDYIFLPLTTYKDSKAFLELKERIISLQKLGTIIKEPFLGQQISFSQLSPIYQAKYNSTNYSLLMSFLTPFDLDLEEYRLLEGVGLLLWQKPENNLSDEEFKKLALKTSDNDGSIALFTQFGNMKLMLLGDLESAREIALIANGLITKLDIQKIGHHGSKTSTSTEFLMKTRPEIALISCGLNNQFGHPNQEILDNLYSSGTQVLRTDQMNSIELISDGQHFWLKDKKQSLF